MTKNEVFAVKNEIQTQNKETLLKYISEMNSIIHDRGVTKSMWFWNDNGNRGIRNSKENYYYRDVTLSLGSHVIEYYRNINMSCKHVYVNESLSIDGYKASVADLKKLIAACEDLIHNQTV